MYIWLRELHWFGRIDCFSSVNPLWSQSRLKTTAFQLASPKGGRSRVHIPKIIGGVHECTCPEGCFLNWSKWKASQSWPCTPLLSYPVSSLVHEAVYKAVLSQSGSRRFFRIDAKVLLGCQRRMYCPGLHLVSLTAILGTSLPA